MSSPLDSNLNRRVAILVAAGVSVVIGLVEWCAISSCGRGLSSSVASRSLVVVVGLYALFGSVIGGTASTLMAGAGRSARAGMSVSAAVIMLLLILGAYLRADPGLLGLVVCAVLAWACYESVQRRATDYPLLLESDVWWIPIGLILTYALARTGLKSDATGTWFALIASALFASLLITQFAVRRRFRQWTPWMTPAITLGILVSLWLLAMRVPVVEPKGSGAGGRASVLLITIDTLRADRVGAYGYARARTPNLDSLASRGTLFRQVVAPAVRTGPSHSSILTGLLPDEHGVLTNGLRLPASVRTVADVLGDEGYVTAAFVSAYPTSDSASGLPSRFQAFDDELLGFSWLPEATYHMSLITVLRKSLELLGLEFYWPYRDAASTTDVAIAWLERNGGRPFFVWVHYFDPHLPYRPPVAYLTESDRSYDGPVSGAWYDLDATQRAQIVTSPESVERMLALYDGEIAFVDHEVGRLLAVAERASVDGRLLVVATADHGESMGEHDLFWGRDLHDPSLRVPLVVAGPTDDSEGRREVLEQVRLIDIAPTILDLVDARPLDVTDGESLVGLIRGDASQSPRLAHSATYGSHSARSVRDGEWKLIEQSSGWAADEYRWSRRVRELYHLSLDPEEQHDVIREAPPILTFLGSELESRPPSRDLDFELSPEAEQRLRSLGYVP